MRTIKKGIVFSFIFGIILILTACISLERTYTITYHSDSLTITKKYEEDTVLTEDMITFFTEKEGYTKEDWYLDSSYTDKVVFPYTITKNADFYLKWIKDEEQVYHTVNFYLEDTLYKTESVLDKAVVSAPETSKAGHTLIWYADTAGTTVFDFTKGITENLSIYGKFEKNSYSVKFYNGSVLTESQSVLYGDTAVLPSSVPNKEGFAFKGWSLSNTTYTAFDFSTPIQQETILYAYFEANAYTVCFTYDNTIYKTDAVSYGNTVNKPANPTKTGYTFLGWYSDENCMVSFDFTKEITENCTVYGKFEINVYTVCFYNQTTLVDKQSVEYGETVSAPSSVPSKTGYTFIGWSVSSTKFTAFDFTTKITTNTTLYAYFEINTYTVSYYSENTLYTSYNVKYKETAQQPTDPIKEGYTFAGWYTDANLTKEFDFTTPITQDIKIYAKFTIAVYYTITFEADNTEYMVKQVIQGKPVQQPIDPAKEGYTFTGWYYNDELFDFTTIITESITLTAKFEKATVNVTAFSGYNEGAYIEISKINGLSLTDYTISYKKTSDTSYTEVDRELIRQNDTVIRCDIIGLSAGTYTIKADAGTDATITKEVTVSADDRSGYAHFGYTSGIGAYKDDGTLKSNAVVVYVTDETKNTVTAQIGGKTYTGLVKIIQACTKSSYALDIRILGEIQTTQWNTKSHGTGSSETRQNNLESTFNYVNDSSGWDENSSSNYSKLNEAQIISKGINSMSNDINAGITQLDGLTNQVLRNKKASNGIYEYDSYYNMLDVSGGYNITIEGIGTDAAIYQWGFAFKKCNSIEIKNIYFHNYTEDAIGFEGASSDTDYGNYWIHNCTFDIGVNNWDVCYEADKGDGDGSSDVKYCHNVTISYCQYNGTHKTNLIGSSDSAKQYNITLHHNYYNACGSRLPLVRQANIHMYNNYYYGSTNYSSSIRANCYAFVENCYYEGGKNAYEVVTTSTYTGTAIKAYNNIYDGVKLSSSSYKAANTVTSRTQTVESSCAPNGTSFSNFDTNAELFYYNSTTKVSDVTNLLDTVDVPQYCKTYSGVLKGNFTSVDPDDSGNEDTPVDPVEPIESTVILTFNGFATGSISSATTVGNTTVTVKSGKTTEIKAGSTTIANTEITKYVSFGGGASYNELSIQFTTSKQANITVYYASSGSTQRYAALFNSSGKIATATTPTVPSTSTIVSYTFENIEAGSYAIGSSSSGLDFYCIVIEYVS